MIRRISTRAGCPFWKAGLNCHCRRQLKYKLGQGERRREDESRRLEVSFLTNKPFDHESIGIDRTRSKVRTHDAIRPRRLKASDVAGCRCRVGAGKRILEDPTSSESDVEIGGVEQAAIPEIFNLGKLILKRCSNDHRFETAILCQRDQGGRKLPAWAQSITVPSVGSGIVSSGFVNRTLTGPGSASYRAHPHCQSKGCQLDSVSVHRGFWTLHSG